MNEFTWSFSWALPHLDMSGEINISEVTLIAKSLRMKHTINHLLHPPPTPQG